MPVHTRGLAQSAQRCDLQFQNIDSTLTSGATGVLAFIPYPCSLDGINFAAFSVASSPSILFTLNRFIPGTGFTSIVLGTTFVPASFGTSGVLAGNGVTLAATNLMTNDILGFVVGGAGGTVAISGFAGCAIVRPLQDKKFYLGSIS